MAITKDNVIGEVITAHPELIETFFQNGMMCIGCPASQGESIEQASQVHGLDGELDRRSAYQGSAKPTKHADGKIPAQPESTDYWRCKNQSFKLV